MSRLRVSVSLHGAVVDDRVLDVGERVRLGESDDAAVQFPGADLRIEHDASGLWLRGRALEPGVPQVVELGAVRVTLEAVAATPVRARLSE